MVFRCIAVVGVVVDHIGVSLEVANGDDMWTVIVVDGTGVVGKNEVVDSCVVVLLKFAMVVFIRPGRVVVDAFEKGVAEFALASTGLLCKSWLTLFSYLLSMLMSCA